MNTIAGKGHYRLASRDFAADRTTGVQIGNRTFGGKAFLVAAGPYSVENEEMMRATGHAVGIQGAALLRGGAFKPRTSPYSFDGLKDEGLRILARVRDETGLPVVTPRTRWDAVIWWLRSAMRRWPPAPTASSSRCIRIRRPHSRTGTSPSTSRGSRR